jgi:hypothetical protein
MTRAARADSVWQLVGASGRLSQVTGCRSGNSIRNPLAVDDLPLYTWRPSSTCDNSGPGIGDGCRNLAKVRLFFP